MTKIAFFDTKSYDLVALRCSGCANVDVDYADGRIALATIPHFLITEALENIAMATIENVVSYYE